MRRTHVNHVTAHGVAAGTRLQRFVRRHQHQRAHSAIVRQCDAELAVIVDHFTT
jgi:hypothetical protein